MMSAISWAVGRVGGGGGPTCQNRGKPADSPDGPIPILIMANGTAFLNPFHTRQEGAEFAQVRLNLSCAKRMECLPEKMAGGDP